MRNIALKFPGGQEIFPPDNLLPQYTDLGSILSALLNIVFTISVFLAFFWMVWGVFHYIFAGGDKEQLSKARSRIVAALVGLLLVAIAFALAQYVQQILQVKKSPILFAPQTVYAASIDIGKEYEFGWIENLGQGVNLLVAPAFAIATAAVTIYLIMGGLRYLLSGGNKEGVSKARNMITHSLIGFMLLLLVFILLEFVLQYIGINITIFGK